MQTAILAEPGKEIWSRANGRIEEEGHAGNQWSVSDGGEGFVSDK